ncbi:MAG TPA: DinB family protein [Methylomirabilota bacterium]|nr:DinB family protein [Methylomirabilota bacterium]
MTDTLLVEARRELARLPSVLEALLSGLDEAGARTRPATDEWSPVEIVCHLRDEETEDFGARLRVIVDGADEFAPIDPERWAKERRYHEANLPDVLEALRVRRQASLDLLASVTPEALEGSRTHKRLGRLSGRDILAAWVAHDRIHLAQLAGTLARIWALRWAPLRAEYAGSIPYSPDPQR